MRRVLLPVLAPLAALGLAMGFGGTAEPQRIVEPKARWAEIKHTEDLSRANAERRLAEAAYAQAVHENQVRAYLEAAAEAERQAAAEQERQRQAAAAASARRSRTAPSPRGGGGGCTPAGIIEAESGGNITAQNPSSTASGKYQFLDSTWAGYGGYARAKDAPESVQDEKFEQTWAGGAGASHWAASVC